MSGVYPPLKSPPARRLALSLTMSGATCASADPVTPGCCAYALEVQNVGNRRITGRSVFGDAALLAFLLAQAFDGVLTYIGVRTFGLGAEGNPLIAWLMTAFGFGPGLLTAKVTAGCFGIVLHLSGVHRAVAALSVFYLVVAVGPWVALLFVW